MSAEQYAAQWVQQNSQASISDILSHVFAVPARSDSETLNESLKIVQGDDFGERFIAELYYLFLIRSRS